jgi:predicted transcriptional regulator of viral defense system
MGYIITIFDCKCHMKNNGFAEYGTDVFLANHPVFTVEEFQDFLTNRHAVSSANKETRSTLLKYHQARGRIVHIRRGLYASIPLGKEPGNYPVDRFLIASRLSNDAVLGYHTALSLHGVAHSIREECLCLTNRKLVRSFIFQGVTYRAVLPPSSLSLPDSLTLGVEVQDRQELKVRVTNMERTIVDVLDRPKLAGGWEEVWRSLEGIDMYLDDDEIIRYTLLLKNATTIAKVGYFLEQNQKRLNIRSQAIERLHQVAPKTPHYVERGQRSNARLIKEWNLMIPTTLLSEFSEETEDIPV